MMKNLKNKLVSHFEAKATCDCSPEQTSKSENCCDDCCDTPKAETCCADCCDDQPTKKSCC